MRFSRGRHEFAARALAVGAALLFVQAGCSRERYFRQADQEARSLVAEKSNDARWAQRGFTIEVDPRSRYFDPCDPVCPPMPPDDPASHQFMRVVDGKPGWPCWYAHGCRSGLENPKWREQLARYVEMTDEGAIVLSLESAVRLAYVNSPSFQNQLETVYLSALDVSTERFRFDVQFFGGNDTTFTHEGRLRNPAVGERNTLETATGLRAERRLATAGELLVGFANSFVWQFAGPDTNMTFSILNFGLVQPLLRGAGRDVALEQLTIAERGLLANLRALQRYRQGFYTNIAIGNLGVSGPSRRGGFFGGTGLTGFTGTGAGGFGGVGEATGFGRTGFGAGGTAGGAAGAGFAGGGAGLVGGFVGLLQQLQQIRNTQESLKLQQQTLRLLEAHLEAGTIDLTQVDQFRQSIETERANLLQAENSLADSLDSYKTGTLGLPPDLPIVLNDGMIRPFQFIDPTMSSLQRRLTLAMEAFGEQPLEPEPAVLEEMVEIVVELRDEGGRQIDAIRPEFDAFLGRVEARRPTLDKAEADELATEVRRWVDGFADLEQRYARTAASLAEVRGLIVAQARRQAMDRLVEVLSQLSLAVDELALVQARARVARVTLEPIDLTPGEALDIARSHRLDWMNNRAALVDTWRLIAFNADALQSGLDVVVRGDVGTEGNNPVKFRGPTGRLSVGLEFDAPFTRLLERNNFRQVLIDYQQDRRQLIQYEDNVHQTLRSLLRQLEQLAANLEIQRRAVEIAIRRVDETREVLNQPPPPSEPGQATQQLGPTAALNLLYALSDLRSSQNNFMSVWLNYYATRMTLMRELGIMEIDENGMWVDRPLAEVFEPVEIVPLPPDVPEGLIPLLEEPSVAPSPEPAPGRGLPPADPRTGEAVGPPVAAWGREAEPLVASRDRRPVRKEGRPVAID